MQEYKHFQSQEVVRDMKIDNDFSEKTFRINLEIKMHNYPCHLLSICQEDELGHHSVGIEDNIIKSRISK